MEGVMSEDGLNPAERRMQSRFSFAVAAGCAAIIALVLALAAHPAATEKLNRDCMRRSAWFNPSSDIAPSIDAIFPLFRVDL